MNEWNLQSRAHACQACEQPFADKEPYHTLLFDLKSEFVRQDVCGKCWESQFSQGAQDRKGYVSHWQGVYEAPPAAPPDPIHRETAETVLRKLTELNDPQYASAAYILAVMLERKRLLKVKEQFHREGQRVFVYEQPKTGDLFTIPDPDLQLDQLEEVHRIVADLIEHGLPQAAAGAETPPSDTSTQEGETADNQPVATEEGAAEHPVEESAPESVAEPAPEDSEAPNNQAVEAGGDQPDEDTKRPLADATAIADAEPPVSP